MSNQIKAFPISQYIRQIKIRQIILQQYFIINENQIYQHNLIIYHQKQNISYCIQISKFVFRQFTIISFTQQFILLFYNIKLLDYFQQQIKILYNLQRNFYFK
ncbi:hypothetical protein pb186bvf_003645 [Paramecium bursaria]